MRSLLYPHLPLQPIKKKLICFYGFLYTREKRNRLDGMGRLRRIEMEKRWCLTWPIIAPASAAAITLNEYRLLGWKTGLLSLTSVRWMSIRANDSLFSSKIRLGRSSSAITRIVNCSVLSRSSGVESITLSQPVIGSIWNAPLASISPYLNRPFSPYFRRRKKTGKKRHF